MTRVWVVLAGVLVVAWAVFAVLMSVHAFSPSEVAIPSPASSSTTPPTVSPADHPVPPTGVSGPNGTHTVSVLVASGETLWEISQRFYGDPHAWPRIMAANHIVNPSLIYPGQRLEVP